MRSRKTQRLMLIVLTLLMCTSVLLLARTSAQRNWRRINTATARTEPAIRQSVRLAGRFSNSAQPQAGIDGQDRTDGQTRTKPPLTAAEARTLAEEIQRVTSRSSEGLQEQPLPNGAVALDLQGRFQNVPLARKSADGAAPEVECVDNLDAASKFLGIDSAIAKQVAQTKLSAPPEFRPENRTEGQYIYAPKLSPQAATIVIVNNNAAGVGFNDPTPVAPVGGNVGTTLGQQRLIAFQAAASIWGATLDSNVTIVVRAQFTALTCTASSAVLGSAGTIQIFRDFPANGSFPGAEFPSTWYHSALANKRSGLDLNPAPNTNHEDINANFNVNLGQPGCFTGTFFYLGLDNNHGANVDLVAVLLHEFAHGLGFSQFASVTTGVQQSGFTDIYGRRILDLTTNKTWEQMTNAERVASAINTSNVVWNGNRVINDLPEVLGGMPRLLVNSPAGIAGNYLVGTASFGPALTLSGITGNVVQALDPSDGAGMATTDACSPLTNAAAVMGKIALVDRGTCGFTVKVKNAQNAGAIAVIVADNAAGSPPPSLGGSDATITIPSVRITQADGVTIKAQLGVGVNATLGLNPAVLAGASGGKALLYTPNPVETGSSISHWDTSALPNQLMEPSINGDLTHSVITPQDLTRSLLRDIGWFPDANLDGIPDNTPSTTALTSSVNPSGQSQLVTFTATVSADPPIGGPPTGTVQFKVDGVSLGGPVTLAGGVASVSTAALSLGSHMITAAYSGSLSFTTSTGLLTQTVSNCPSITVLPVPPLANGFLGTVYNQTLTATGGTTPYTFAVTTGSLPGGLNLASGGALTGTPTAAGTFSFTVTATDNTGCTGTRSYTVIVSGNGLQFYPLASPVRLLDTRAGQVACSQPNAPILGQTSLTQPGRSLCGIPANAVALTGNVTTVQSGGGFLTLYPSNAAQPTVASVNYGPNETLNNVFTVGLGTDGAFKIFAFNTTEVVVDVTGYYAPPATGGLFFHPLPKPIRLLETRAGQLGCNTPGQPIQSGDAGTLTQQARITCDGVTIPSAALAIVGNATTVNPQGGGFLTLFPGNAARPLVAASNYNPGQIVNGPFSVGLAPNGEFKIFTFATTDLVVDVLGYYSTEASDANGAGLLFSPLPKPVRLLETRTGQPVGCFKPGAPLNGQQEYTQTARGLCDGVTVPANALGGVGNATVVGPLGPGFLTLWPSAAARPLVATANYNTGEVGNRHFIVGLGQADGAFKMYSFATTHLVIDLSGYFAP